MAGLNLSGKVAIVTGGGAGLGRAYALQLASQGAAVLVNDPGKDKKTGASLAEAVVAEITAKGGKAAADTNLVTKNTADAERIVKNALDKLGGVHILVNNAGMLRDVGFRKQTDDQWSVILEVHLYGQRNMIKACWETFYTQGYGRVVNVGSINGVLGAHGQSNYSAAKSGVVGLTFALAKEGEKKNIKLNAILPGAGTALTATVMPQEVIDAWKPEYVAPLVGVLCSDAPEVPTGKVFEGGSGFFAELEWRRAAGVFLDVKNGYTADDLLQNWSKVRDMSNCAPPDPTTQLPKIAGMRGSKL